MNIKTRNLHTFTLPPHLGGNPIIQLTLEDKLGYWLERYAWNNCGAFDIYLVIEEHHPFITEDEVVSMCTQFEKEVNNEKYEYFGIDWHIDNFINNLKNTIK